MQVGGLMVMPILCDSAFGRDEYGDLLDKSRAVGNLMISRTRLPPRQHQRDAAAAADRVLKADEVRPGQARRADPVFPGLRRPVRLQWRLPQGPVRGLAILRRAARTSCAWLQAFLPPRVDRPMRTMAGLLARAPAELMQIYDDAEDARRGRNEACTCGSGRAWMHCHGGVRGG